MKLTNSPTNAGIAMAALISLALSHRISATTIGLSPSSQTISVGGLATVDLVVSHVPPYIGGWDVTILFDSSILGFNAMTFGSGLNGGDLLNSAQIGDASSAASGQVHLLEASLLSSGDLASIQTSTFILASLQFTGLVDGISALHLSGVDLSDEAGNSISSVAISSGSITVATGTGIPDQGSTAVYLGLGMAALAAMKRRAG